MREAALPFPLLRPPARRATRLAQLTGPRRGPRLSWESGRHAPGPRVSTPKRGAWDEIKSKKEAPGGKERQRTRPRHWPVQERLSVGLSQAPDQSLSVPLRPRSVSCAPQEGTTRRRLGAPRSGAAQGPGPAVSAALPVSGAGWPLSPPSLRTSSPGAAEPAGLASLASCLLSAFPNLPCLGSASSTQPSARSHFSHFFLSSA